MSVGSLKDMSPQDSGTEVWKKSSKMHMQQNNIVKIQLWNNGGQIGIVGRILLISDSFSINFLKYKGWAISEGIFDLVPSSKIETIVPQFSNLNRDSNFVNLFLRMWTKLKVSHAIDPP